jgi:hypothetical protein
METTYQHDYKNPNVYETSMAVVRAVDAKPNKCGKEQKPTQAPPCPQYPRMVCFPLMAPMPPCCPQPSQPCEQPYKWTIREVKEKAAPKSMTCCCRIECRCESDEPRGSSRDCSQPKCRFLQQLCTKYPELFDELKKCDAQIPLKALSGCSPPKRQSPCCQEVCYLCTLHFFI